MIDMAKFIYVFCAEAADLIAEAGFDHLLTYQDDDIYVFTNNPDIPIPDMEYPYIMSDILTL